MCTRVRSSFQINRFKSYHFHVFFFAHPHVAWVLLFQYCQVAHRAVSIQYEKKIFFLYGWLFGLGYFISNLYWISISLTFDESFKFLIPLTIVLVPAFLALFYGLASFLFLILKPKKNLSSFFLFSLIFGTIEFIRGTIMTGFPWNLIAYSFSNYIEILSITSIIGTYSFNLFCISLFTSTSFLILRDNKKEIIVCITNK